MPAVSGVQTLMSAPPGYIIDFKHPQRQAVHEAYWIAGVGALVSLLLMFQRLYTKMVFVGELQWDDAFLVMAYIISMATIGFCIHMFAHGVGGVHTWEISIDQFNVYLMDVYLAAAIYIVGGSCAKISLLLFYLRLSPQQWFRIAIYITLAFISCYTIGIFFALVLACDPIAMSWDVRITEGKCINRPTLYIATAVVNIISDVILFILPLPVVLRLQIPRRQKVGLLLIFVLGSVTVVTSIIRVTILPQMLTSPDQTWVISWASVWIIVESNLIIICAALPTIRKFLRHVAPKLVGESASTRSAGSGSNPNPPGLRTIGMISTVDPRKKMRQYSRFGASEEELSSPINGRRSSYELFDFASENQPGSCTATIVGDEISHENGILAMGTLQDTPVHAKHVALGNRN